MATNQCSDRGNPAPAEHAGINEPLFEEFQRFHRAVDQASLYGNPVRRFAELVADLAGGAAAIIHLSLDDQNRAQSRADNDPEDHRPTMDRPLLRVNDMWTLQRMAAASLRLLEGEAEDLMKWAYEHHTPEGVKERIRRARLEGGGNV